MRPDRHQAGFTLVEVMVVTLIMGLALVAAIPAFRGFLQSNEVSDTARELSGRLRLARQSAVGEGIPRIVVWDPEARAYSVVRDDNEDGVAQTGEPTVGPFTLREGVNLDNSAIDGFSSNQIVFNANGTASETGTIVLSKVDGFAVELTVLAPTGQVRLN